MSDVLNSQPSGSGGTDESFSQIIGADKVELGGREVGELIICLKTITTLSLINTMLIGKTLAKEVTVNDLEDSARQIDIAMEDIRKLTANIAKSLKAVDE